jgi:hypothetical protein
MPTISEEWGDAIHDYICDQFGGCVMTDEGIARPELRLALWFEDSAAGIDPVPVRAGDNIQFPIHEGGGFKDQRFYPTHYTFPSEDAARAAMAHVQLMFSLVR